MEIEGTTKVYGLIGNPVAHSISPLIHNLLAQKLGLDMTYVCFPVENADVKQAVEGAWALGIQGLNVTVPHKQSVREVITSVDPLADAVGAVNTLVRTPEGFTGYNTDVEGFAREAKVSQIGLDGAGAVVIGAGGAARGVCFSLARAGAKRIVIANRTAGKAELIADAVNGWSKKDLCVPQSLNVLSDARNLTDLVGEGYLAVQATSVGLYPKTDRTPVKNADFFIHASAGIDIIYNPEETRFMSQMRAAGHPAFNGLAMLLFQGIASFELWTKMTVPQDTVREVYAAMQQKMAEKRK
ncbi:MAG: shikimate dehydrogenase [Lachnospiraceae bacterium]|jgi:shikimate dehydrogenase